MLRGLIRNRTHVDGSYSKQEPRLRGPAAVGLIAILGLSRAGPNSKGSCQAGPNFIYSVWVWQPSQTQSQYIFKKKLKIKNINLK
jgi:hypothetical protein